MDNGRKEHGQTKSKAEPLQEEARKKETHYLEKFSYPEEDFEEEAFDEEDYVDEDYETQTGPYWQADADEETQS